MGIYFKVNLRYFTSFKKKMKIHPRSITPSVFLILGLIHDGYDYKIVVEQAKSL